ncbi:MAG: helix-turn-helix transcriptional regulator [Kofleriaceae bacterium]|nr:helix-turn-helix transcriptional regulator [Kofleriaceae bacterium]
MNTEWERLLDCVEQLVASADDQGVLRYVNRLAAEALGPVGTSLAGPLHEALMAAPTKGGTHCVRLETDSHDGAVWDARVSRLADGTFAIVATRVVPVTKPITQLASVLHVEISEARLAQMVTRGLSNEDIAQRFGVPVSTIKNRILRLYRKLGVKKRAELMARVHSDRCTCSGAA